MLIQMAPLSSCPLPQWVQSLRSFFPSLPLTSEAAEPIKSGLVWRSDGSPSAAKGESLNIKTSALLDPEVIPNKSRIHQKALLTEKTGPTKAAAAAHVFDLNSNWLQSVDRCGHSSEPPPRGFCSQPANYFQSYCRFQHG